MKQFLASQEKKGMKEGQGERNKMVPILAGKGRYERSLRFVEGKEIEKEWKFQLKCYVLSCWEMTIIENGYLRLTA